MMRVGRFFAVAAACVLLVPAAAVAQSSIAGSVTDDTGGVLPGVTIEATSEVLIGGARVAFTDGTGLYNIINLLPGLYTVTFTMPGFATLVRDELILGADIALPLDAVLAVGSVEETVTVSGETPVVDIQQVQRIEVLTKETQEAIPTGRSAWSYAALIPGVKVHKADVGGTAGAQQAMVMGRGLDAAHNMAEIDGVNVTILFQDGRFQQYLNPLIAAETSYTTTGQTAESQQGGVRINMIPNEGGNTLSGQFFGGGTPAAFQSDNLNQRLSDLGVTAAPNIDIIYDFNGSIGGPIKRDKLWLFAAARRNVISAGVTNSFYRDGSPGFDDNSITNANVRLTYQVTNRSKFSVMFDKVRKRRFHEHGAGDDIETASSLWGSPHYDTGTAKWTSALTNRVLLEGGFALIFTDAHLGRQPGQIETKPAPADIAACFATPCFPAVGSARHLAQMAGGDPWYSNVTRDDDRLGLRYDQIRWDWTTYNHRWTYMGAMSYVTGSHSIKVGTDWSRGNTREQFSGNGHLEQRYSSQPSPFGTSLGFIDSNCNHFSAPVNVSAGLPCGTIGTPNDVVAFSQGTFSKAEQKYNGGFYAQDSWTVDRLTLNYGARIDIAAVGIPALPHPQGRFVGNFDYPAVPDDQLPSFGPEFSPRLSAAYDLFGNAKTALKFGWNKYVNDVTSFLVSRYSTATHALDTRDWFDLHMNAAGTAPSGLDPYGSNGDNIAQNWEIGVLGDETFGIRTPNINDVNNFEREYNHIWTAGIQQEIMQGLSLNAEFRRRVYRNTWSTDNVAYNLSDFGALPDGSPDPAFAGTGRYFDLPRPYPGVGSITIFNIDPAVRTLSENHDRTVDQDAGYSNVYTGFEVSMQGRLPGGGALFGGWTMEDGGRNYVYGGQDRRENRYGGEVNQCADVLSTGDNPNELRWCDASAYPRPYRHELKLSGTQPFSLPGVGDMQVGGSLQSYAGGASDSGGFQEGFFISRTSADPLISTYSPTFYGQPGQCVAPCVLGGPLAPAEALTIADSTSNFWAPTIPLASVKFPPNWVQLDVNLAKVFNVGNWRYDARFELFNALNNGIELQHTTAARNARGSTGAGFQSVAQWERPGVLLEGRVIRFAVTARF